MKKVIVVLIMMVTLLSGCMSKKEESQIKEELLINEETSVNEVTPINEEASIFESFPEYFTFSSGAGAWSTELYVEADGSFSGTYHDSDMGDSGDDYPNGTLYLCNFKGKFTEPVKIDDYTYSMKIETIELEQTPDEVEYEDGFKYVYSEPYGLENADEFLVYLPGALVSSLPEEYLSWTMLLYEETVPEELPFYGIYNVADQTGFQGVDEEE